MLGLSVCGPWSLSTEGRRAGLVGLGWDKASCRSTPSGPAVLPCLATMLNTQMVRFQGRADYQLTGVLLSGRHCRRVCVRGRGDRLHREPSGPTALGHLRHGGAQGTTGLTSKRCGGVTYAGMRSPDPQ